MDLDHCTKCGLLWPARKLATPFGDGKKYCPKCHEEAARRVLTAIGAVRKQKDN